MNWNQFKNPVPQMHLADAVVAFWSLTQEVADSNPFTLMIIIFTIRNEVAKVMFLHLSVCPQGGSA